MCDPQTLLGPYWLLWSSIPGLLAGRQIFNPFKPSFTYVPSTFTLETKFFIAFGSQSNVAHIFLYSIIHLVFEMETLCVFCEVGHSIIDEETVAYNREKSICKPLPSFTYVRHRYECYGSV
jgi:hypothetical protein